MITIDLPVSPIWERHTDHLSEKPVRPPESGIQQAAVAETASVGVAASTLPKGQSTEGTAGNSIPLDSIALSKLCHD
jgi:hypothetical protein